jgi:hypothetical protein
MATSLGIAALVCEVVLRVALPSGDYLSVETVPDETLGIRIAEGSPGVDAWGYRNRSVPPQSDVVAIGDSHTYGNAAGMDDAWPSVAARLTGLNVYNMGIGGYGPNQYYHVLKTRGLTLAPTWVVCGLYFGDDFENAFSITHGLEKWSHWRTRDWGKVDADIWDPPEARSWHKGIREWLARNSMIYRLTFHGPLFGRLKEEWLFRQVERGADPVTTWVRIDRENIREAFRPIGLVKRLDQENDRVREGMRITFKLLSETNDLCARQGCRFVLLVIPTKEMVFAEYLERNEHRHLHGAVVKLIANERLARQKLFEYLDAANIHYIDALPALRRNLTHQLYATTPRDMHPNRNGYSVLGQLVAEYLKASRRAAVWD